MVVPDNFSERTLVMWDGAAETWVQTGGVYQIKHREYRSEFTNTTDSSGDYEWITQNRLVYRFRNPALPVEHGDYLIRGRLIEIRDQNPATNRIRLAYRLTDGVLTHAMDSGGGAYLFKYGGIRLSNVTFQNWAVNFHYDASNKLVGMSRTAPAGYSNVNTRWSFFYNGNNGLLERIVDPRSNDDVRISYDKYGRMTNEVDALNRRRLTEYGVPAKRQIRYTDPDGYKWIDTFDRKGRLTSHQDPLGFATYSAYNEQGNITSETDPLGRVKYYGYDERGNKLSETNAYGLVTRWQYNWFNKPTQETDPLGWTNYYEYDAAGNLLRQYDALGTLVAYTYATNGLVLARLSQLEGYRLCKALKTGLSVSKVFTTSAWLNDLLPCDFRRRLVR